jgi:hypothetical protein
MSQGKASGEDGRDAPIENPAHIRRAMLELHRDEIEFPVKVEGAQTLPYTSHIQVMDFEKGVFQLKLIRPLPHEMAVGAPFEMLFAVGEQRFEAPITYLGREAYLLYRFSIPVRMSKSDRRRQKRYPFRPREQAYVLAQDGGLPGHGLAGPLVNLSLGGLAFRVDRVMRLDDHMRLTPGLGFFDKGKVLPVLKIRDLPKLPLFEARGMVANAFERGGEIVVGVQFADLGHADLRVLQEVLNGRDQMQRTSATAVTAASVKDAKGRTPPSDPAAPVSPIQRADPSGSLTPDALTLLARRCMGVVLAMAPGPDRVWLQEALASAGYLRMESVDTLELALESLRTDLGTASRLLLVESPAAAQLRLADIRTFQRELGELRELPVALIQAHGLPQETDDPLIRPIPWPGPDAPSWLPLLDELAGL